MGRLKALFMLGLTLANAGPQALASDWPQFMRDAAHTGDAADESLSLPLSLVAQVKLDDAVLTSPAVAGGLVYVVDQMGTAYCVDPRAGKVVWKTSPEGSASDPSGQGKAMGSNTSSPCVAKGRVCYGTSAGNFHILDAKDGKVVKTIAIGSPIPGSPAFANDRIYFQALDAVVRCLDLDGNEKWAWEHYKRYTKPVDAAIINKNTLGPLATDRPHYGGGEVAVSGKFVVTGAGWDLFCLEDAEKEAKLSWCNRASMSRDHGVFTCAAICGDQVYAPDFGADGAGGLLRVSLKSGTFARERKDLLEIGFAILGTPAVRGQTVYFGHKNQGEIAHDFEAGRQWSSCVSGTTDTYIPVVSSPALSKGHCAFTTVGGELIVVDLASRGSGLAQLKPAPFRFKTPHGKCISSSPSVSGGCVYFGCDDGFLYVLGPGGSAQPRAEELTLHQPKGKAASVTGKATTWPTPNGNMGNTRFVDDPSLKPPFRLRWAVRELGAFRAAASASERDLFLVTMDGMVLCLEQASARLRWRLQLPRQPGDADTHGVLCANGRVYVARPQNRVSPSWDSAIYCLDELTGKILWSADIGAAGEAHSWVSPVLAGGRVAFASVRGTPAKAVVQAWDAETGKFAWEVELNVKRNEKQPIRAPAGCALGETLFFSAGGMTNNAPADRYPGETVAIEAKTGRVLWRTSEAFTTSYSAVMARDDKVYILANSGPLSCLSAKDGNVLWKVGLYNPWQHGPSLGSDYMAVKGYGGHTEKLRLEDGKPYPGLQKGGQLGGLEHTCSSAVLTSSGLSLLATVGGLYARDVNTGALLWQSPMGFAPRNCANTAVAGGRIFVTPQSTLMLYCFESEK